MKTEQDSTANPERPTALPPATGSGASKREEILVCLEVSRQAKRIPWPDGIGVKMVAEYQHNVTGQIGCVVAADQDENEIELWFDQHNRWGGTIQDFQRDWSKHQNADLSGRAVDGGRA